MLNPKLSKQAHKFLKSRLPKHAKQIAKKIVQLASDPEPQNSKYLKGYNDYLRDDVGEYRIIYKHDERTLWVIIVGKRNDSDVYKKFRKHEQ